MDMMEKVIGVGFILVIGACAGLFLAGVVHFTLFDAAQAINAAIDAALSKVGV